jgi:glutathione S-transferase
MADSKPVITYWAGVKSRLHYTMTVVAYNGKTDAVTLNGQCPYPGTEEWKTFEPKSVVGQLPHLSDGDISIGQSIAILNYLSRKFGLYASATDADFAMSEQLIQETADLHSMLGKAHYGADRTAAMDALLGPEGGIAKHLTALEGLVKEHGWFTPTGALPGDLALAASLDMIDFLDTSVLDASKYPKLRALLEKVRANEGVKAYYATVPYPYFKRNSD